MAKFADLVPLTRSETPLVPDFTVENAIRRAAIQFCEQSLAYRARMTPINYTAKNKITLPPYDEAIVFRIINARVGTNRLKIVTVADLDDINPNWESDVGSAATHIALINPTQAYLTPKGNGPLYLTVALKPSTAATEIEDFVYEEWSEAFMHGALSRLLQMPEKPWTNRPSAEYHEIEFRRLVQEARVRADKGFGNSVPKLRYGGI